MKTKYPIEVLTTSKKGKREVRSLVNRGTFVRYEYLDPETGERTENKIKLVLKTAVGPESQVEEFFIIPMKDTRQLLIPVEAKGPRKLWDNATNEAFEL